MINPPPERENTITRYRIVEEDLIGQVREPPRNYDLMTVMMLCLGSPEEGQSKILRRLSVLLSSKTKAEEKKQSLEEEFSIPMTQTLERSPSDMGNLSEGVMEKGRAEGILVAIKNLMYNMNLSAEQAMAAVGLTETERLKYAALLQKH